MNTFKAKAKAITAPYKSELEKDFSVYLENLRLTGQLVSWHYEPIGFRLGENVSYKPDFMVINNNFEVSFYEVKGSWKQINARDSRTRIKIAASQHKHFNFIGVTKKSRAWLFENF